MKSVVKVHEVRGQDATSQTLTEGLERQARPLQQLHDAGSLHVDFEMAEGIRKRFLEGSWDSATELLANRAAIANTAKNLPYLNGFAG